MIKISKINFYAPPIEHQHFSPQSPSFFLSASTPAPGPCYIEGTPDVRAAPHDVVERVSKT